MTSTLFIFLRRMRRPLLLVIFSYALGTLGLVLIPGADEHGQPVRLTFLDAFYIISYTGTTIGYGEIPHPFTTAQRLWMLFAIYLTVTCWVYSIGVIIALLQEPALRRVIARGRFAAEVRRIGQPFYLVCGYGDTGSLVVRELRRYGFGVVVLDIDRQRLDELSLLDLGVPIPTFCHDASQPEQLVLAGLTRPQCVGVLGLTGRDEVNLAVAMAARLLNPGVAAICRSYSSDTAANMASFGTRHIVNPFQAFGERLGLTLRAPSAHTIYECLTTGYRRPVDAPLRLPHGRWVVCGYGRFGQASVEQLRAAGLEVTVVAPDLSSAGLQASAGAVAGRGTEATTLVEAGIGSAVGILAGTDNSINNLSIVVTARELNPRLFTVAREVSSNERLLFRNAGLGLRVQLTHLAASEAVELLRNPLLPPFLDHLNVCDEAWAAALLARMAQTIGDVSPATWVVALTPDSAPAPCELLAAGRAAITPGLLLRDPRDRERSLAALVLLVRREGRITLLPEPDFPLRLGDELLFCGRDEAQLRMSWARRNVNVLSYLATGVERPSGWVWQWLARRAARRATSGP